MRDTVYCLVFDDCADRQCALALCEIRRPDVLAVSDRGVISASHLGSVEFTRAVIHTLDLYSPSDREDWYRLFKHAQLPSWCVDAAVPA